MKISKKNSFEYYLVLFLILIIFILEVEFFYLIKIPYNSKVQKIWIVLTEFIAFLLLFNPIVKLNKKSRFIFNKFIFGFIMLVIVESIISMLKYNLGFATLVKENNYLFIIGLYYIFTFFVKLFKKRVLFINIVMWFSAIAALVIDIQYFMYNQLGPILNLPYYMRFNDLRITEGEGLINIGTIIAIGYMLNKKIKNRMSYIPYLCIITGIINIIFVQKTRIALISLIITLLLLVLIKYIKRIFILILSTIIIISFYFLAIQGSQVYNNYLISFEDSDYSLTQRNAETEFYMNQFKNNPILGMGYPSKNKLNPSNQYLSGPMGLYYRTDVGFIGFLNTYGILGGIWYILLFLYCMFNLIKFRGTIQYRYDELGLLLFIILSSTTLIVTDVQRIIGLSIMLTIVDTGSQGTNYPIKEGKY